MRVAHIWIGMLACFVAISLPLPLGAGTSPQERPSPVSDVQSELEKRAADLEAYLVKHPADEKKREEALWLYSGHEFFRLDRLKYHTFGMIEHHPGNNHIVWQNATAFYADREYALDVVSRLEDQAARGHGDREVYWLIAYIAGRAAIPPVFDDADERRSFMSYFRLPETATFPSAPDEALAEKSIRYYRLAIEAAHKDSFYAPFYATQLGGVLMRLNRFKDALAVYQSVLPVTNPVARPSFLVAYGICLRKLGRCTAAKAVLVKVRGAEHEGFQDGPACETTRAENILGEMALDEGSDGDACKYLLSSCKVQRCCHNITQGLPLKLAKALLQKGQYDAVVKYCKTALTGFVPGDPETQSVLKRALAARQSHAVP